MWPPYDLSWIPYCCVINLEFRPDRLAAFESFAEPYGLTYDVFLAKRHPISGLVGCWDSHMQVFRRALARDVPFALVLEDDCIPSNRLTRKSTTACWHEVRSALNGLESSGTLDYIVGLGGVPMQFTTGQRPNLSPNIYGVKFGENHAYFVSRAMMQKMVRIEYQAPADTMMPVYCDNMYLMSPELFIQDPLLGSDNNNIVQSILPFRYTMKNILHWIMRQTPVHFNSMIFSVCMIAILLLAVLLSFIGKGSLAIKVSTIALFAVVATNHAVNVIHLNPEVAFTRKYKAHKLLTKS